MCLHHVLAGGQGVFDMVLSSNNYAVDPDCPKSYQRSPGSRPKVRSTFEGSTPVHALRLFQNNPVYKPCQEAGAVLREFAGSSREMAVGSSFKAT